MGKRTILYCDRCETTDNVEEVTAGMHRSSEASNTHWRADLCEGCQKALYAYICNIMKGPQP